LQAQQRISDTWRSVIGSTAIAVVNAYMEADKTLDSDEDRQKFAEEGLKDLKFLYSNTNSIVRRCPRIS
jgi:hypothetical protein